MIGIRGLNILDKTTRDKLSRLHVLELLELDSLFSEGYGNRERILEVKADSVDVLGLALSDKPLSQDLLNKINEKTRKSRPVLLESGIWTYEVEDAVVELWYPMFGEYYGSGRLKECKYEKCRRIYVPTVRGGKHGPKYCSKSCYYKGYKTPYMRDYRRDS